MVCWVNLALQEFFKHGFTCNILFENLTYSQIYCSIYFGYMFEVTMVTISLWKDEEIEISTCSNQGIMGLK